MVYVAVSTVLSILLVTATCSPTGEVTEVPSSRIVNGEEVNITDVPYYASLGRQTDTGWSHECGGSIISSSWVLSAAHCLDSQMRVRITTYSLQVTVGSSYRTSGGMSFNLSQILVHESYSYQTLENDIALLVTSTSMTFSESVSPIAIAPKSLYLEHGTEALVSGFGTVTYGGMSSTVLLATTVYVVSQSSCIRDYQSIGNITDGMLCAGADNPARDACQGDSGGPLVAGNYLIGIVSWGEKCADPSYPGVYTRVSEYESWITTRLDQYT